MTQKNKKEPTFFLIGTKKDLQKDKNVERNVTIDEIIDFCKNENIIFVDEISLKDIEQEKLKKMFEKILLNLDKNELIRINKEYEEKNYKCPCIIY